MKSITTRSGVAYEGPSLPTSKKVVERETEEITDKEQTNFQESTAHIQPPVTPISEPDVPKNLPKPNIPYPSRLNDQKLCEKDTNQMEKFFQIFQDLHFDISFVDALILMPKFASMIKSLLTNKDKLFELAKISLNENFSAMLLKKLPEKLGDPGKFLIPCYFPGMDVCHALADLDASINLRPLSIWKKLSLPELTPTRMTLELADRSITRPKGVAEDVFFKVGKFHFPTNFVVVDFKSDPRVPLILRRSFLRTGRALIDVYGEEITLRVNDKAVTFNLNQTTRYSSTYDDLSVNRIDIIDVAREEYAQEILGFSNNSSGGNPTSTFKPILSNSSPSLTPFEGRDICLIEKLLNNDPFQLLPMDLKQGEVVKAKSSIEEPRELELKYLPSHLKYAYLEGVDKLPVIIAKDLKVDVKEALLKVLKSHKRTVAWKITDIKGIDHRFCTHKILMGKDYKPDVQSQRRVNTKIHEVIKKEVIKLLDAGMIYPIFNSPWVSPIHCVTKKCDITVVENENNELIPTRLVIGWRVCIDYRKLNDATHKDHFSLLFMDQMLEQIAGNKFYCFLDGLFGYYQILINLPDQENTTFTCPMEHLLIAECPLAFTMLMGHFKDTMLQRCEDTNFVLNWEKCHFMVKEGIVLGHKISKNRLEVGRAKVDVIAKLPYPTTVKDTPFVYSKDCIDAFETLKKKLTEASILVVPDWNLLFKLMCDASDFAIGAVLGQLYTDHSDLKYLLSKQDAKPRLIQWVLLLQEFNIIIRDKKGTKNLTADHLSRLENPYKDVFKNKDINENFPLGTPDFMGPFPSSLGNRAIISDRGTHFCNDKFAKLMSKYGVTHRLSTAYHPQTSGQVKVLNRCLKRILERTVGENHASWSEKLDDALWAFRTAYKTPIECTPYKLVYRKSCHLPIELEHKAYWTLKHVNFNLKITGDHRNLQLNEHNELRDQAYENSLIYKEKMKKLHDSKIKNHIFNVGPFTITKVFPYGIVELSQPDGPNFKVNGHRVKHCFGGDVPQLVVLDLQTFPMDK
nr:reverse transcriptase domain-containing protein [Tanacetum cinerariifolium]